MSLRKASCACGQVVMAVDGEPEIVAICGCQQCQRRTGSVYSTHAFFAQSGVKIEGDYKVFARKADSGNTVTFHFCPECGSTVFWRAEGRPNSWGIALGALSGVDMPPPIAAVWGNEVKKWVPLPEGITVFSLGADSPKLRG
ncbi:hypothetical protein DOK_12241 [gamma proteobacterium BDW918]|jgi:hypothetical protein|uniref:GFA family protein n=1 Tax=Spongiibacter pelagi TaxID=2760804 RepID=A0A927C5Q1_9GAMM|nr:MULTISPECIES: GFA family protein [Cellvibrionales]EIF42739.1 hypothetical protein DOK_12241 [gamma proteobacterium BDW918]MAT94307.1 aldehyde-activating protein [Halioglobus sp.]MAV31775.1 aldehyde-activating protein [Cycloclasticus sp.]MAD62701.1 aldehyde-activating protein [Haliea sp.]MAD65610.1 aldehyde-activating protein [Haliea sp.]|tara:strand:+ start:10415 stop:10840 length:426 start_codon:yes stop_codon:yes gene_type:complete